jgi:hypothetical protein
MSDDITNYVDPQSIDWSTGHDATVVTPFPGLRNLGPITLTGHWEPTPPIMDILLRIALAGRRRLPRKSKKAFKKWWSTGDVTPKEHQRIRQLAIR